MAFLEQRTFETDCPAELITAVNDEPEIGATLEQIVNDGGPITDFWFDAELDDEEEAEFDAILTTWDCDNPGNEPDPDPGEVALDHKRDKIAGIVNRGSSWMDFDFVTNELTLISNPSLAPDVTEFNLWTYNTQYTKTADSIIVPTVGPNYLIFYNEAGELEAVPTTDGNDNDEIVQNAAIIARTSVNVTDNKTLLILDLRYDVDMDPETRNTFIKTVGTTYDAGLALMDIEADGNGDEDIHAQFSVQDGDIFLADIIYNTATRTQDLSFPAQIPIWYRIGQEWYLKEADDFPMVYEGSVGDDYTGTLLPYNHIDSAGNGSLVEVPDHDFVLVHYFATSGLYRGIVGIQGQAVYGKANDAREGAEVEIATILSVNAVKKFYTPIATVIYSTYKNDNNTPHARIVSYTGQDRDSEKFDYYDLRTLKGALGSGAGTPTPVIDNLESTSATNGLSANMGRELEESKLGKVTGFNNVDDVNLEFNYSTGVLDVIPSNGIDFTVWVNGVELLLTGTQSYTVSADSVIRVVYFDETGVLQSTTSAITDESEIGNNTVIVSVNSNVEDGLYNQVFDIRYTVNGIQSTRRNFVREHGAHYYSGFDFTNLLVDGDGSTDAQAQFGIAEGFLNLADIYYSSSNNSQQLTSPAQILVLYNEGTSWKAKPIDDFPFVYENSVPNYTEALMPYNSFDELGMGSLVSASNGKYVNMHYFASVSLDNTVIAVQGMREYGSIEDASNGGQNELGYLLNIPYFFTYITPIGSIIYQTSAEFTNTTHTRMVSFNNVTYVDNRKDKSAIALSGGIIPSFLDDKFHVYNRSDLTMKFNLENLDIEENQTVKWSPSEFDIDFRSVPDYTLKTKAATTLEMFQEVSLNINGHAQAYPATGGDGVSEFTARDIILSTMAYQSMGLGIVVYKENVTNEIFLKLGIAQADGSIAWGTETIASGFDGDVIEMNATPIDSSRVGLSFVSDSNHFYTMICTGNTDGTITHGGLFEIASNIISADVTYNPRQNQLLIAMVQTNGDVQNYYTKLNNRTQTDGKKINTEIKDSTKVQVAYNYDDICVQSLSSSGNLEWVECKYDTKKKEYKKLTDVKSIASNIVSLAGFEAHNSKMFGQGKTSTGVWQTYQAKFSSGNIISPPEAYGTALVGKQSYMYNTLSGILYNTVLDDNNHLIIWEGTSNNPSAGFTKIYTSTFTIESATVDNMFILLFEAVHAIIVSGNIESKNIYMIDSNNTRSDNYIGNNTMPAMPGDDVEILLGLPIIAHRAEYNPGDIFYLGPYKYQVITKHQVVVILEEVIPL